MRIQLTLASAEMKRRVLGRIRDDPELAGACAIEREHEEAGAAGGARAADNATTTSGSYAYVAVSTLSLLSLSLARTPFSLRAVEDQEKGGRGVQMMEK